MEGSGDLGLGRVQANWRAGSLTHLCLMVMDRRIYLWERREEDKLLVQCTRSVQLQIGEGMRSGRRDVRRREAGLVCCALVSHAMRYGMCARAYWWCCVLYYIHLEAGR